MTFLQSAYKILKQEKRPMHVKEITTLAIEKGLLKTKGGTPWETMASILRTDIKDKKVSQNLRKLIHQFLF